ncbi:DNA replication and repair protein RecF [Clostridia bacterium]|nr:DNA replication and repair protein RecF [Clostridia bacterium]
MILRSIELEDFRNYHKARVDFDPELTVIHGHNGQGKTNLLEAIHILSFTKSMRNIRERECVRFERDRAFINGKTEDETLEIAISLTERKLLKRGGGECSTRDWLGALPAVFFGPQELNLVREGPSTRRRFLDMAICGMHPAYVSALSMYKRALEHKKKLLIDRNTDVLPEFNDILKQKGAIVADFREKYFQKLAPLAAKYYAGISSGAEVLELRYAANSLDNLDEVRELEAGQALYGPHRDDIKFLMNGREMKSFGSQGQVKSAAIAVKLAERQIIERELNTAPVMLLDDVLSELDENRLYPVITTDLLQNHLRRGV